MGCYFFQGPQKNRRGGVDMDWEWAVLSFRVHKRTGMAALVATNQDCLGAFLTRISGTVELHAQLPASPAQLFMTLKRH